MVERTENPDLPDTIPAHMQGEPESELKQHIVAAIKEVYDPEIPVNVYDLGLIYNIAIDDANNVDIVMTLTAPNCPAAGILPGQVEDAAATVDGVGEVHLELTFDPPFSPAMMSEEAKLELGFM
jgi:FeS assembly SUF system protein